MVSTKRSPGKWFRVAAILVLLFLALFLLRYPLLRTLGNFLINTDPQHPTHAIYVLGGASYDRGIAATHALRNGVAQKAWCLGEQVPLSFKGEGLMIPEGRLTANVMLRNGADTARVEVLLKGTSTWDESLAILDHAQRSGFDSITVITTDLHTRRVSRVFKKVFHNSGITVLIHGADASLYDAQRWWATEEGLLMVNNEYVKLLYYLLKY